MIRIAVATAPDIPRLIALMSDFYAEAGFHLNTPRAADGFAQLIANPQLGQVWIFERTTAPRDLGYLVVTFRFTMEYGGLVAHLDDLFVLPEFRNQGCASQALRDLESFCSRQPVRALFVETGHDNAPALTLYQRAGFRNLDRQLLALPLDDPAHHASPEDK